MTRVLALLPLVLAAALVGRAAAQDTLDVERLQEAALRSDPRTGQRAMLRAATDLRMAVVTADRLPQVQLNGQATHQSDVTRPTFGLPGVQLPDFPKDRWQTTLDVTQRLYDGGDVARRRELEEARHAESEAALDVSLYELRSDVNSAFFSAFLFEKRSAEFDALVADLDARLAAVRARVDAGTALGRDAAEIEAERVRAGLQRDEARASRRAALAILADLTGEPIDTAAVLALPTTEPERRHPADLATIAGLRRRPEFDQLRRSRERLDREIAYTSAENRPRVSAFGQAGVGLPGLDQFRTSSDAFWQAGIKVEWRPWTWRSAGRKAAAFRLQQDIVATEEQALGRRLARAVVTDLEEIDRLKAALADDERIVTLRTEVERQARAQYDEGAVTTPDYVEARTDVLEARLTLERHRVELAQARARYLTTLGLTPRGASDTP
jgi:outer membrane protein TolC